MIIYLKGTLHALSNKKFKILFTSLVKQQLYDGIHVKKSSERTLALFRLLFLDSELLYHRGAPPSLRLFFTGAAPHFSLQSSSLSSIKWTFRPILISTITFFLFWAHIRLFFVWTHLKRFPFSFSGLNFPLVAILKVTCVGCNACSVLLN